jgi:uncharacterized protein
MAEPPDFQQKQYAFAAHIRDPQHNPAPDAIEDRRMGVYRDLFFNNLSSLLSSTFPVLKKIHAEDQWRLLIRNFMIHHQAETPYFLEVPQEFLKFLKNGYPGSEDDFPFLLELAHYEWVELELSVSESENDWRRIDAGGDLLDGVPVKSKLAYVLEYQFPVQNISTTFLPVEPGAQPTYLSVFRKADDELGFMELNPVTARLLQLIDENSDNRSGRELLLVLAGETGHPEPDKLIVHGLDAMQQMKQSEIILGTLKPDTER